MNHLAATLLVVLATTSIARAEPAPAVDGSARRDFHVDVEVDPTAYILSGYSVHAGLGWRSVRLDLGVFAMDLPEMFHGNAGWDASFYGGGAKLQWFPLADQRGLWVDASVGVSRRTATLAETGHSAGVTITGIGIDAGYRFSLPYNLYITPWAGIARDLSDTEVMVDGKTFAMSAWTPFAAVHVGFRFR